MGFNSAFKGLKGILMTQGEGVGCIYLAQNSDKVWALAQMIITGRIR